MVIKIMKKFNNGRMETTDVYDIDLFGCDTYTQVEESMKKNGCSVIVITLESGFQVLYTEKDKF